MFELDGLKFSISICYDMQFRSCAMEPAAAGAKLLPSTFRRSMLSPRGGRVDRV